MSVTAGAMRGEGSYPRPGDGVADGEDNYADDNAVAATSHSRQGAAESDFSVRAVAAGLLIGCLLAFTNLYLGLQSGWISMMSLQSALLGFALFRVVPRCIDVGGRRWNLLKTPFTPQENVLVQTTAAAVGVMPLSAGLVGVIPALKNLRMDRDGSNPIDLSYPSLVGWCFALAYFGVFFASPLREPMIIREKLTFPSGTATAQLIGVLHGVRLRDDRAAPSSSASALATRIRQGYADEDAHVEERAQLLSTESPDNRYDGRAPSSALDGAVQVTSAWSSLMWSFIASFVFTVLSYYLPVLYAMPLFDVLPPHNLAAKWGFWFTPSLNYIGQGIIMGLPTTVSMTAGALVGWGILSPLAYHLGWAPGHPLDSENGSKGWILWISLAIMCSESIVGLVTLVSSNGIRDLKRYAARKKRSQASRRVAPRADADDDADADARAAQVDHEPPHRQTPTWWVTWGLVGSTLVAVALIYLAFGAEGISPWATFLGIVLASVFAILGVRALGETDLNPVSGIGKISQLIFALVQPGNVVANLIAGGISEAGAMQAGDLMQDYKTGHLVGASPRAQFQGQLIGSTLGIVVSSFAYKLYTEAYEIPGPQFPAPTAAVWLNLARLVNRGHLPTHAQLFMVVFGALFAVTGIVRTLARSSALHADPLAAPAATQTISTKIARYLPSGIAFAVGMLNTPNFSLARLVGGCIAHVYYRRQAASRADAPAATKQALAGIGIIIIASGFVLGEGAASILTLLLQQHGAAAWSCMGCRGGCSNGCS